LGTISVNIDVGKGYEVFIGRGILSCCGQLIAESVSPCRAAIITDSNVGKLYLETVTRSLVRAGFKPCAYTFEAGEASKNMETLSDALEFLADSGITRSDLVVALGGGVTGDMAGFASGGYLRGIKLVQIPTTLLSMVDSSVGGKTAVNLSAGKNLAGIFKQPEMVVCDTDCLHTLPEQTFADGAAEAIKYGVLTDRALFDGFEGGVDRGDLPRIIARCVEIKGKIAAADEFDVGQRRLLNLGHTIGHAVEKCSNFEIPHGHAVAAGMVMIARAGENLGYTQKGVAEAIAGVLRANGLPVSAPYGADELCKAAMSDKKRFGGSISLVFPEYIGSCRVVDRPVSELRDIIELGVGNQ